MVYSNDTLEICHELTELGINAYSLILQMKADEILFKAKHPIKYWVQRLKNLIKYGDSTWDGAHYSQKDKYKDGFTYVI